jgi:hypothetical protein
MTPPKLVGSPVAATPRGRLKRRISFALCLAINAAAFAAPSSGEGVRGHGLCPDGWWADFMIGSYHVRPYRHFDDFNPGVGIECSVTRQWAAAGGYFRNSLDRPSFYAGALYTPQFAHWRWFRVGAMGGVISGYNFGRYGVGSNHRTGLVLAPTAITEFGRFGMNFILIPPIRANNLPFTVGFQAKYRFK